MFQKKQYFFSVIAYQDSCIPLKMKLFRPCKYHTEVYQTKQTSKKLVSCQVHAHLNNVKLF